MEFYEGALRLSQLLHYDHSHRMDCLDYASTHCVRAARVEAGGCLSALGFPS